MRDGGVSERRRLGLGRMAQSRGAGRGGKEGRMGWAGVPALEALVLKAVASLLAACSSACS